MFKRFFSFRARSLMGAALIVAITGLISRFLGVIRDRVLAGQFGAGETLDIYFASFRVPDFVYNLVVLGALSAGFIPVFISLLRKEEDRRYAANQEAWQLVNNLFNILGVFLVIVCGALALLSPWIVPWITPGFTGEKLQMTVALSRIMFLSPFLLGLSGLLGGVLQSFRRFFIFSLAPVMYNIGIIIGALVFVRYWGIYGLAWGVILGAGLHLMLQIPTAGRLGYRYHWFFQWRESNFLKILKLTGPRILGLASQQLNLVLITVLASTLAAGSVAIFNLANNLQNFPIGLVGIAFGIAVFPVLSKAFAQKQEGEFRSNFLKTFKQILFFIIPLSILLLVLRVQIVRVILGSGQFGWNDTILTANALGIFCLSLFAQALLPLMARAFYARHNTWLPFWASMISVALNLVLSLIFIRWWGVLGLVFGFTLSSAVNFILLAIFLRAKVPQIYCDHLGRFVGKLCLASLVMGVVIQYVKTGLGLLMNLQTGLGIFTQGFLAGLVGLAVFALVAHWLKVEELRSLVGTIKRKLWRKAKVEESIVQ